MSLSLFYIADYTSPDTIVTLDEDNSRHVIQVLRMKRGDQLQLTDGKGTLLTCSVEAEHKKHCTVKVIDTEYRPAPAHKASIAISLVKNANRFEWFLEKATEIGINTIIPLICERTEKEKFRHDRMQGICISAMLQSQQAWLPVLHQPIAYELLFRQEEVAASTNRYIAHCIDEEDRISLAESFARKTERAQQSIILIGPEGDFTNEEIAIALQQGFQPVTLGETRLRTETAGVVAATLMKIS